jgi:hypothetical protein
MDSLAFQELNNAATLDEVFSNSASQNFILYIDEEIHSTPDYRYSAEACGKHDARLSPPQPNQESKEPERYVAAVYAKAETFVKEYQRFCNQLCEKRVKASNMLQKGLEESTSEETLVELQSHVTELKEETKSFNAFKEKYKRHSPIEWSSRPSRSSIISIMFFIAASEFACVWFVLKENLGDSNAILASFVAVLVIITLAFTLAFSHALTAPDTAPRVKKLGNAGIILSVIMFLLGLGVLTAYRADVVGFDIIGVLKSFGQMDIFGIGIFNTVCFGTAAYKFRPAVRSKLWNYQEYEARVNQRESTVKQEQNRLQSFIKSELITKQAHFAQLREYQEELDNLAKNHQHYLGLLGVQIQSTVETYVVAYITANESSRTTHAYPSPEWFRWDKEAWEKLAKGKTDAQLTSQESTALTEKVDERNNQIEE